MTRAEEIAERAAFLARTFGESVDHDEVGVDSYRLFDRAGRMTIGCSSKGTVSIILDGHPALFRWHGPGNRVHVHPKYEDALSELLGFTGRVIEI
jgi:hypothetical protein